MGIDATIWLEKVRAVPTIGARSRTTFESAATILPRLRSLLAKWDSLGGLKISFEDNFKLKVERPDGLQLQVTHDNVVCKFYYLTQLLEKGTADPALKAARAYTPYRDLLKLVSEAFLEVVNELNKGGNREIVRIGVVAEGAVDPSDLPPGFSAYFEYISRIWNGGDLEMRGDIISTLSDTDEYSDKCHHNITYSRTSDTLPFILDWQRYFKSPVTSAINKLTSTMEPITGASLDYFGKFGLGDLGYD